MQHLVSAHGGLVGLYMRLKLEETPDYRLVQELKDDDKIKPTMPVIQAIREHWALILLGAAVVTGGTVGTYVFQNYVPAFLNTGHGVPLNVALGGNLIGLIVYATSTLVWGRLSDTYGRKPFIIGGAIGLLVLMYPIFLLDQTGTLASIAVGQSLFGIAAAAIMGLVPTLLSQFFPTALRMSGLSVSYTLANALFGGTAPFVVLWLVGITGTSAVSVFYCMGALLLTLVGGFLIKDRFNRPLQEI